MTKYSYKICDINKGMVRSIWLFLFVNSVSFVFLPSLTTTRLAFLLLLIIFIVKFSFKPVLSEKKLILFASILVLSFYVLFISLVRNSDFTQFSRLFHFAFFSIMTPFILVELIRSESDFHKAIVVATVFQVLFVFITYTSRSFNDVLFSFVLANNNFIDSLGRAPGFSSSGGATLSVVIALGAFSVLRLSRIQSAAWHFPVMLLIIFSNILVGRTGLLISCLALAMFMIRYKFSIKSGFLLLCAPIVIWFFFADDLLANEQFINFTLRWALSAFSGDGTVTAVIGMGLPEMSTAQLLFGTGWVALPDGMNASGSDSGYVQTMYAMGLILTILFYFGLLLFLVSYVNHSMDKIFSIFIAFLPFILELKEPFIFKYAIIFYVLTSLIYLIRIKER